MRISRTGIRALPPTLACLLLFAGCEGRSSRPAAVANEAPFARPNVLLISIDTLRADRLNSYGYGARAVSPAMDALARDGILFENHITTSPWTTPAHLSLLTSLYPSTHGMTSSFFDQRKSLRQNRGFLRLAEARLTLAEALGAQGWKTAAFTGGITMDPRIGFGQGFSLYDTSMYKLGPEHLAKLEGWIEAHAPEPFFLFWHTFEVHAPYLRTTFLDDALPAEKAAVVKRDLEERALLFAEELVPGYGVKKILKKHGVFNREVCDALYMGGVRSMDHWVGELVAWLRRKGLYERTLIVLTSDHGEELGQRSLAEIYDGHGHTQYEELVRVPLIVKLPGGGSAGTRVRAVTSAVDVMPTILEVARCPPERNEMQGRPLRPLWEHPESPAPRAVFAEALGIPSEMKAMRDERYKYIFSISPEVVARFGRARLPERPAAVELYDLQSDPHERVNLLDAARGTRHDALGARLDAGLRAHQAGADGKAENVQLDADTIQKLKSLGYIQ